MLNCLSIPTRCNMIEDVLPCFEILGTRTGSHFLRFVPNLTLQPTQDDCKAKGTTTMGGVRRQAAVPGRDAGTAGSVDF